MSGEGDLAATLLITTRKSAAEAAQLSFVAAFAVRDLALRFIPEDRVKLKWPNDVLVCGAKLSGVLIESGRRDDGALWLAVGVGVNLVSAPEGLDKPATCIAAHLPAGAITPSPAEALLLLSAAWSRWLGVWESAGFGPLREAWMRSAIGLGERCVARLGERTVEGVAVDLDGDGALVLRLASGELQRITAGDVFFGNP